jgi:hypothetical protein
MSKVNISDSEFAVATMLAIARRSATRGHNVEDRQVGKQDAFEIELDGMLAEIAFAKQFNYYPDLTVGPRSGGEDFKLRDGKTVDIKATRHLNGRLLATQKKQFAPCDLYVLAIIETMRTVNLVGYISCAKLFREENLIDLGHGTGYGVTQDRLNEF